MDKTDKPYARRFGFYPFQGNKRGKLWRIWSIAWVNLSHQLSRSRLVKIWLSFIAFILILSNLMLLSGPSYLMQSESPNDLLEDHLWGTIRKFIRFQVLIAAPDEIDPVFDTGYSIFMLIGFIMIGAGLISDDKRYKVLDIYDSKIDRKTYLTGKYGTLILFGNLLFTLPCIIEWGLLIIKWEELFERKASIQERLKQARVENYIVEAKRIQEAWVRPSADTFNQ